jgi:hypothetical protein
VSPDGKLDMRHLTGTNVTAFANWVLNTYDILATLRPPSEMT